MSVCTGQKEVRVLDKIESDLKDAKYKIREQEAMIARLRAELAAKEAQTEILLEKKALEVEVRLRGLKEEAYERGFEACKKHFSFFKELQM